MEKSTPIGLVAGFVLVFGTVAMGDGMGTFFDPGSILIVLGGTIAGLFVTFTMDEFKACVGGLKGIFGFKLPDYAALADQLADFARTARRDGPLALDARMGEVEDPILQKALEMAIDGVPIERAEATLKTVAGEDALPGALLTDFLNKAGMYAPAFGMVGTLIGLIQMLQNLSDPSAIGPAMAVAMITTFWGALLANLIFLPLAGKARAQMLARVKTNTMIQVGALGLLSGEAPGAIAQQLAAYTGGDGAADDPAPLRKAA